MDMYNFIFTQLQHKIFRLLCIKAGNSLNQREIAKSLKVSPTAVAKALILLEKQKLIVKERQKNLNHILVNFNRDNMRAIQLKRVENLKLIYESGLVDFLEEKLPGVTIVLFGSYARGEDTVKSDIDLAVIGSKEKEIDLENFNKLLEREVRINFYGNWKEIHKNLKDNILNGIVLIGGIEL